MIAVVWAAGAVTVCGSERQASASHPADSTASAAKPPAHAPVSLTVLSNGRTIRLFRGQPVAVPAPLSRWRTGTLAAAGTIPVTAVTAPATLVRSKGYHPAKRRPAIPARVYESGSGGSRHAAPVRHPCLPRPPPATALSGKPAPRPQPLHMSRERRLRPRCRTRGRVRPRGLGSRMVAKQGPRAAARCRRGRRPAPLVHVSCSEAATSTRGQSRRSAASRLLGTAAGAQPGITSGESVSMSGNGAVNST